MAAATRHRIKITAVAAFVAAALFFAGWISGLGVASVNADSAGVYACIHKSKGTIFLRLQCQSGERRVLINRPGPAGAVGLSSFDLAKSLGFNGTLSDWLKSLTGPAGPAGSAGTGATGPTGPIGPAGSPGFVPAFGSFIDTTSQLNTAPGVAQPITYNSTVVGDQGVTITSNGSGNSRITFAKAGTYDVQFSAQVYKNSNQTAEQIDIWLSKQGVAVPYSNTQLLVVSTLGKIGKAVASWNFFVTVEAGQYCELLWESDEPSMQLPSVAADSIPSGVAIPSMILTVNQVG